MSTVNNKLSTINNKLSTFPRHYRLSMNVLVTRKEFSAMVSQKL